jgi:hypothetical protein
MGKQNRQGPGLTVHDIFRIGPVGIGAFDAELIGGDGVEEGLGFAVAGEGGLDATFEGKG